MGFLSSVIQDLIPSRKQAVGSIVPTWDAGRDMMPPHDYQRMARDGYMLDELVFDCVDLRATAAGEPPVCAYKPGDDEKLEEHPALDLMKRPNPFLGRSRFWATIMMCLDIGGNAYVEKVRSRAGKVVELWPLRPDRMRVIPSQVDFIAGYRYEIGAEKLFLPAQDVIHFKTRHPVDDYYGLSPLAVLAGRVDLDIWQRRFTEAFFRNAGVPSGLLNIKRVLNESERQIIRDRFTETYGGPRGWFKPLVIDSEQATYTSMGLPLGDSGLALEALNQVNETRILGVYGIPASLITTMVGMAGNRGQTAAASDRELFWESTMQPLLRDLDSMLTIGLLPDFPDLEYLEHDLSVVRALQEDEDKLHARWRETFAKGLATFQEARAKLGMPPEPDEAGIVLVPSNMVPTWSDEMLEEPEEEEPVEMAPLDGTNATGAGVAPAAPPSNGRVNGSTNGATTRRY